MKAIGVLHYGIGNVGGLHNAFRRIGVTSVPVSSEKDFLEIDKIVLPGVGKFDAAIAQLRSRDLINPLNYHVLKNRLPVLGICLGMQLMGRGSVEGKLPGLNWLNFESSKLIPASDELLKVPNMGWSKVEWTRVNVMNPEGKDSPRFYFAHSYAVADVDSLFCVGKTHFGSQSFASVIQHENIFGAQFHPEKSHVYGMEFLANFAKI
jgi:glutamine amidotransferase